MDQTTEAPDAYEEHVRRLHSKIEEQEKVAPRPVTCNISFSSDEVEGLLFLIEDNISRYKIASQGLLVRAATKLRDALSIT